MQHRSRLGVGTHGLLFAIPPGPCSTCSFASSQQQAISTSADLEVKRKLFLDELFKYLFLFKGDLWTFLLNKI